MHVYSIVVDAILTQLLIQLIMSVVVSQRLAPSLVLKDHRRQLVQTPTWKYSELMQPPMINGDLVHLTITPFFKVALLLRSRMVLSLMMSLVLSHKDTCAN
jgi:hypothetical protein